MSDQAVTASIVDGLGHINLRGNAGDDAFRKAAEAALGQSLPIKPNTVSEGGHRICWLGPDEWLVTSSRDSVAGLLAALGKSTDGMHAAINDVSGSNVVVRLSGAEALPVFAKGCTLDLHPDVFRPGDCAQSGLGKAIVLLSCIDDTPTFEITVRRSFADYLLKWLRHAGREYGIEFG